MKIQFRILLVLIFCTQSFLYGQDHARPLSGGSKKPDLAVPLSSGCFPAYAQVDLDINNVRARIHNAGTMWWDFANARYEIPKGGGVQSVFSGGLWLGAIDNFGQLRVAAQTYRQTGEDFWPGPVDTVNRSITDSVCGKFDRIWKVDRMMVEEFMEHYGDPGYVIPEDILEWPGNGDVSKGQARYLAPFVDVNADGIYSPLAGDYPAYDFTGNQNCEYNLLGDQTLWWVFNDVGNVHSESGGAPLGLEIHAQAFAYRAGDEVNDMTFYQYKVINRSTFTLGQMHWGEMIDIDLGCYIDDYVACDVARGLGYVYNGDSLDEVFCSSYGYGLHPPAIGIDYLGGPLADQNDGVDNDRDSVIDEPGERIQLSNFIYYDGINGTPFGNPTSAQHMYFYTKSLWGDGQPVTYGMNGYNSGGPPCKFMFPKNSDPYGWGTGGIPMPPWGEESALNTPADRRFVASAGPFTMLPGSIQFVTNGMIWARDTTGDNYAAIAALQKADDKAQVLFDNCFSPIACISPEVRITSSSTGQKLFFNSNAQGDQYQWDLGDGTVSTDKFPKHTYAADGIYQVCVKVTNACGSDSACVAIEVNDEVPPPWGFRLKRIEGNGNGGNKLEWMAECYDSVLTKGRIYNPVYDFLRGPVRVEVYDTVLLPRNKFILKFDGVQDSSRWKLYRIGFTDTVYSDTSINAGELQDIPQWGMRVKIRQVINPGHPKVINNGFLEAWMTFNDPQKSWLNGLPDDDLPSYRNWIRSGPGLSFDPFLSDYSGTPKPDSSEVFESLLGGTWAPYRLAGASDMAMTGYDSSKYYAGPGFKTNFMNQPLMKDLASVDIIITPDKSKWSRCVVLELSEDTNFTLRNSGVDSRSARKLDYRRSPSVDKNGVANYPSADNNDYPSGMGWFPGYAVNLETGERLNIAFGENSALRTGVYNHNGGDMIWNPTSAEFDSVPWMSGEVGPVFGGQHYIYVFGHNKDATPASVMPVDTLNVPAYDKCGWIRRILSKNNSWPFDPQKREIYRDAMWVNIPLLKPGHSLLESEVKISIRVGKAYSRGYSNAHYLNGTTPVNTDTSSIALGLNRNFPMYEFDAGQFGPQSAPPFIMQGYAFYPNPLSESSTLWFENPDAAEHELKVYDIRGRMVRNYSGLKGQYVVIRKGTMRAGVYFYYLTEGGTRRASGKFIVIGQD